ncbi:MAG: PilZ domain-containing protein [Desulfobulbaceae bacterium]|nr:MAG: PilZ domain-containing protein [Desulfobulbaceae bacterium]
MTHGEKRKFIRLDSIHLLDYIIVDTAGVHGRYSMGRTLDVSLNGLKLETVEPLEPIDNLEITVGVEEDLVDLLARITHTEPAGNRYVSGLEFIKMSSEGRRVFRRYTEAYRQQQEAKENKAS